MWSIPTASYQQYISRSIRAVEDPNYFPYFKLDSFYSLVIGSSEPEHAFSCLQTIVSTYSASFSGSAISSALSSALSAAFSKWGLNDMIGGSLYTLGTSFGTLSGDALRYGESVFLLSASFGSLTGKTILEVGPAYGGLAHQVLCVFPSMNKYYLADFPEVNALTQKYFLTMSLNAIPYDTASVLSWDTSSLVTPYIYVSEYALTENDSGSRLEMYSSSIKPADGFFIRSNIPDFNEYREFVNMLSVDFNITASAEIQIRSPNVILIGNKK